jgi:hypothetical protein
MPDFLDKVNEAWSTAIPSKLVDNPVRCYEISKYLWNQILFRIRDWNMISKKAGVLV